MNGSLLSALPVIQRWTLMISLTLSWMTSPLWSKMLIKGAPGQCIEIPRNIHQVEGMFVIKEVFGSVLQVQWCKVPKQVNIVRKEFGILLVNTGAHPPSHGVKLIGLALNWIEMPCVIVVKVKEANTWKIQSIHGKDCNVLPTSKLHLMQPSDIRLHLWESQSKPFCLDAAPLPFMRQGYLHVLSFLSPTLQVLGMNDDISTHFQHLFCIIKSVSLVGQTLARVAFESSYS